MNPRRPASSLPLGDGEAVGAQYEKWVYPLPVPDLNAPEQRSVRDRADPERNQLLYWPDGSYRDDFDILVAGCGSNAAARYAFHYPNANVVGVDLSRASLDHERYLQNEHGLGNLTLHQLRLEEIASLGQEFDFIDCCGVLHHLPDPLSGLRALGGVLRTDGVIAIMLYGRYGRAGIYMVQDLLRRLGLGQSEEDVATAKQVIGSMPERHPIHDSLARTRDVEYDAGLVDTFLHPIDRSYTADECVALVREAGLVFQGWWDNVVRYAEGQLHPQHPVYPLVNALPDEEIWPLMELYNGQIGQHTFCACLPSRPTGSYRIDFDGDAFLDYVPVLRSKEVGPVPDAPGSILVQRGRLPAYPLAPDASSLYRQIDGLRSIRECFGAARISGDMESVCRDAFRYLWRLSYVVLRLPTAAAR